MSIENPLWGAPRIHGELLKLTMWGVFDGVGHHDFSWITRAGSWVSLEEQASTS